MLKMIPDLAQALLKTLPEVVSQIKGLERKLGKLQDQVTYRDNAWHSRDEVHLPGTPCPVCGFRPDLRAHFCPQCGTKRKPEQSWEAYDRYCPYCHMPDNQCTGSCPRIKHRR